MKYHVQYVNEVLQHLGLWFFFLQQHRYPQREDNVVHKIMDNQNVNFITILKHLIVPQHLQLVLDQVVSE